MYVVNESDKEKIAIKVYGVWKHMFATRQYEINIIEKYENFRYLTVKRFLFYLSRDIVNL